jgi:hypothetical protein
MNYTDKMNRLLQFKNTNVMQTSFCYVTVGLNERCYNLAVKYGTDLDAPTFC